MVRVTVEMLPHGDKSQAYVIDQMLIINNMSQMLDKGSYDAMIAPNHIIGTKEKYIKIKDFSRKKGAWELIFEVLKHRNYTYKKSGRLYNLLRKLFNLAENDR